MTGERDNIRDQLSAYLDGELAASQQRQVEAALEEDAELRAELEQLRRVRELVGSLPVAEAPEGFVERVVARAERDRLMTDADESKADAGGAMRWARMLATAAVLLIAAGAGFVLVSSLFTPEAPTDPIADDPETVDRIARDTTPQQPEEPHEPLADAIDKPEYERQDSRIMALRRAEPERPEPAPPSPEAAPDRLGEAAPGVRARLRGPEYVEHVGAEEAAGRLDKDRHGAAGADDLRQRVLAEAQEVVLYSDDVAAANETVVRVLNERGIIVEPPAAGDLATPVQWASNFYRPRAAFANTLAGKRMQIVAFVPAEDLPGLLSELELVAPLKEAPEVAGVSALGMETFETLPAEPSYEPDEGLLLGRGRREMPAEPAETDLGDEILVRDMLRRQLDRQTALKAAVETRTTETPAPVQPAEEEDVVDGRADAEPGVQPLVITVIDAGALTEALRQSEESEPEAPETAEPTEPAPSE